MSFNALIVDDEEYSRQSLYFLLQENCPGIHISAIAKSVAEARALLKENTVDIVFLDIAMPNENGFELLPQLQEKDIAVIFTTAYDQYAIRAIKASAIDYLLKPIDIPELQEAVQKAVIWLELVKARQPNAGVYKESMGNLVSNMSTRGVINKLTLPHTQGFHVINIDDITYIEADSNYSVFYLKNDEKIMISKPLKEYEDILTAEHFVRIHKSAIINMKYLKDYSNRNGSQVTLEDETVLPVSRRRVTEFLDKAKAFFNK